MTPRARFLQKAVPLLLTGVVIIGIDQLTKSLAAYHLPGRSMDVVAGVFRLTYAENTGAAWSVLADLSADIRIPLFVAVSLAAIALVAYLAARAEPQQRMMIFGLGLVLGGSIGNLIDRVGQGYVVDFLEVYWRSFYWPVFNVADTAISIGVALLVFDAVRGSRVAPLPSREVAG